MFSPTSAPPLDIDKANTTPLPQVTSIVQVVKFLELCTGGKTLGVDPDNEVLEAHISPEICSLLIGLMGPHWRQVTSLGQWRNFPQWASLLRSMAEALDEFHAKQSARLAKPLIHRSPQS